MSDKLYPNAAELILSRNRNLTIKRTDLVKQGLALAHELKKRQVEVLLGDYDDNIFGDNFSEMLSEKIVSKYKDRYDLKVRLSICCEEIQELAKNGVVDIFVLIMNNLDCWPDSVQLITQIKTPYERPVIAFLPGSLCEEYPSLLTRIKLSADFFLLLPFTYDDFLGAFEKCLEMIPGINEAPRKRFKESAGQNNT